MARQANDTNENRAEWPQRIVILITTGARAWLFSRWIYVRDVTQSSASQLAVIRPSIECAATRGHIRLLARPFWNANFTPMPGYLPCFRDKRADAHASLRRRIRRENRPKPTRTRYQLEHKSLMFFSFFLFFFFFCRRRKKFSVRRPGNQYQSATLPI